MESPFMILVEKCVKCGTRLLDDIIKKTTLEDFSSLKKNINVWKEEYLNIAKNTTWMRFSEMIWNEKPQIRLLYYLHCIHPSIYQKDCKNAVPTKCSIGTESISGQWLFFKRIKDSLYYRTKLNYTSSFNYAFRRYLRFLQMIKKRHHSHLSDILVPTYDIDYIWHSHMMLPDLYNSQITQLVGFFLDHNDQISDTQQTNGLLLSKSLYSKYFGKPYLPDLNNGLCIFDPCWLYCRIYPVYVNSVSDKQRYESNLPPSSGCSSTFVVIASNCGSSCYTAHCGGDSTACDGANCGSSCGSGCGGD